MDNLHERSRQKNEGQIVMNLTPKPVIITATLILIVAVIVYLLTKQRPVKNALITSKFGYRTHPISGYYPSFHNGLDLSAPAGTPIKSILSGIVEKTGYDNVNGYYIQVKHLNGHSSFYGHMKQASKYNKGAFIFKGDVIGYVGSTGASTGPHVHFIVFDKNNTPIDPQKTNFFKA